LAVVKRKAKSHRIPKGKSAPQSPDRDENGRIRPQRHVADVRATDCDYHVIFDSLKKQYETFQARGGFVGTSLTQVAAIELASKHASKKRDKEHQVSVCVEQLDGRFRVVWLMK
jgi:hypothetical protein